MSFTCPACGNSLFRITARDACCARAASALLLKISREGYDGAVSVEDAPRAEEPEAVHGTE